MHSPGSSDLIYLLLTSPKFCRVPENCAASWEHNPWCMPNPSLPFRKSGESGGFCWPCPSLKFPASYPLWPLLLPLSNKSRLTSALTNFLNWDFHLRQHLISNIIFLSVYQDSQLSGIFFFFFHQSWIWGQELPTNTLCVFSKNKWKFFGFITT